MVQVPFLAKPPIFQVKFKPPLAIQESVIIRADDGARQRVEVILDGNGICPVAGKAEFLI
ncbi:MAG: hypothetical protein M3220_22990 [Chloroflexota bacterium]|nr:hypothetical protein [Chloroflexota bacterium]